MKNDNSLISKTLNHYKDLSIKSKKKNNIFNISFLSRIFIYSIIIGFFYNLTYYSHFKLNIFDYVNTYDLIFSWIGSTEVFFIVLLLTIIYIYHANKEKLENELFYLISFISFILCVLTFKFIIGLLGIMMIGLILFLKNLKNKNSSNNKTIEEKYNEESEELKVILASILITIIYSWIDASVISQKIQVEFIKDSKNKIYYNQEMTYVGRTSSVTILENSKKDIVVINNSDISSLTFLKSEKSKDWKEVILE